MNELVVLIEVGVEDLPNPVVTKDDRITNVSLDWTERMGPRIVAAVRDVLEPLRDEHPRFAYVLDRLDREYPR